MRWGLAGVLLMAGVVPSGGLSAQGSTCVFDTASRRDTMPLEFSVRAYRNADVAPDKQLTALFGDLLRGQVRVPPSAGTLISPRTHAAAYDLSQEWIFGTLELVIAGDGSLGEFRWFARSRDAATDSSLVESLHEVGNASATRLSGLVATGRKQHVRLQFLAGVDTLLRSPLFRMRVPMIRLDSIGTSIRKPKDVAPALTSQKIRIEFTVDESGQPIPASLQLVWADGDQIETGIVQYFLATWYAPAWAGGCPMPVRRSAGTFRE